LLPPPQLPWHAEPPVPDEPPVADDVELPTVPVTVGDEVALDVELPELACPPVALPPRDLELDVAALFTLTTPPPVLAPPALPEPMPVEPVPAPPPLPPDAFMLVSGGLSNAAPNAAGAAPRKTDCMRGSPVAVA